jgi:SOS-response transcriptional repressor LexA
MWPTLTQDQVVVVSPLVSVRVGSIVMARIAGREVVKRVTRFAGDMVELTGDNQGHSWDSRQFGLVHNSSIVGAVLGFPPSLDGHKKFVEVLQ